MSEDDHSERQLSRATDAFMRGEVEIDETAEVELPPAPEAERAEEDDVGRPAFEQRFGTDAYEAMLTDCLWGVYQMIGKRNPRIYVLSR